MPPAARQHTTQRAWLWALLPLLLAAALVIPALDDIAFNGDEIDTVIREAGAFRPGPWSPLDVWRHIVPDQALGWPLLLSLQVRIAGWSEVAVRAPALFAGLLTLALVYRAGRDLFAPRAGLYAALLLSAALFLQTNMLHARVFPLVTLFATLCLWAWWRCALHPHAPGRGAQAALLLGATGLLYSHYFGALLLPALGLCHLLFVPKNRRWWRPVLLFGLAGLIAMAQLPLFLRGLQLNAANEALRQDALTAPALLAQLLRYLGNDLLAPTPAVGELLVILLPPALLVATLLPLRARRRPEAGRPLLFLTIALLTLLTIANALLQIVTASRMRYLIALWPLTALLAGAGLHRLAVRHRRLAPALLTLWLLSGVWPGLTTDIRYELGHFHQSEFHRVYRVMREHISADDLLVMDYLAAQRDPGRMYTDILGAPREILYRYREAPYETLRPLHTAWPYLWLLYLTKDRVGFADLPRELGRVFCERVLDERGFTLERYALHSVERCPERPVRLEFGAGIRLGTPKISVVDGTLRLDAHFYSVDAALPANYSLAIHIIDPRSGARVAQGDTGVGPGRIVPLRSEIDLGALPRGEYALRVALYDWRSGARLPARDLETGAVGEMLTLQRFRVG